MGRFDEWLDDTRPVRGLRANDVKNHAKEVIHCLN